MRIFPVHDIKIQKIKRGTYKDNEVSAEMLYLPTELFPFLAIELRRSTNLAIAGRQDDLR